MINNHVLVHWVYSHAAIAPGALLALCTHFVVAGESWPRNLTVSPLLYEHWNTQCDNISNTACRSFPVTVFWNEQWMAQGRWVRKKDTVILLSIIKWDCHSYLIIKVTRIVLMAQVLCSTLAGTLHKLIQDEHFVGHMSACNLVQDVYARVF